MLSMIYWLPLQVCLVIPRLLDHQLLVHHLLFCIGRTRLPALVPCDRRSTSIETYILRLETKRMGENAWGAPYRRRDILRLWA